MRITDRCLYFTRGSAWTGIVLGGRLTLLVLWSMGWQRLRMPWATLVEGGGGTWTLRVGSFVANWLPRRIG